jgi:uncharacterized protein YkwD
MRTSIVQRGETPVTSTRTACLLLALGLSCAPVAAEERTPDEQARVLGRTNEYRRDAGVPPLAAHPKVQAAAQSHAQYMADTGQLSHAQAQRTSKHFTGDTLEDRLRRAGAAYARSGEVVGLASQSSPSVVVDDLMNSVYHRLLLLSPGFTHAGAGVARGADAALEVTYVAIDFIAPPQAGAGNATPSLAAYPPDNQREVPGDFDPATETPNPFPQQALVGQPVSVQTAADRRLVVNEFRLSAAGQPAPVEAKVLTQSNDMQMPEWAAVLVPLQPLLPGTTYEARFSGTIEGAPVERTWRFTTATTRGVVMSFAQAVVPAGGTQSVRLRNLDRSAGSYIVCYEPAELVRSSRQEEFGRFTLTVNRCAPGARCTVTVLAAQDEGCREPFARGSFQVGG